MKPITKQRVTLMLEQNRKQGVQRLRGHIVIMLLDGVIVNARDMYICVAP
jgi:uncharacterized protein YehS (DUF1456 family)